MKNIELKISLPDNANILKMQKMIGAKYKGKLSQIDTYFHCSSGRIKTREINNRKFELIFYKRPSKKNSKMSDYQVIHLNKGQLVSFKWLLGSMLGEKAIVKKTRNLWIYKNTRIHHDKVFGLGNFLELETVANKIDLNKAKEENGEVIRLLKINQYIKLSKSYGEMVVNRTTVC